MRSCSVDTFKGVFEWPGSHGSSVESIHNVILQDCSHPSQSQLRISCGPGLRRFSAGCRTAYIRSVGMQRHQTNSGF